MNNMILLCACACMVACVAPGGGLDDARDPEVSRADDGERAAGVHKDPVVLIDARATDDPERIRAAAESASLTACHGTTSCPGGILINPNYITVNCGEPYCSNQPCFKTTEWTASKQPRERYRSFAMPDGSVCLAYEPATAANLLCDCSRW